MVDISSGDKKINITVSTSGNKASVNATPDTAMYYSNKSREWAISDKMVSNEDYSSKYYANVSKQNADKSTVNLENLTTNYNQYKNELENTKNISVEEIETAKTNAITDITNQETLSVDNVNTAGATQVNLAEEQATIATEQAEIATAKASEVVESGVVALSNISNAKTEALTDIITQETTSKNNVEAKGAEQINLIQNEGATQVANVQSTGFYMRDDKLYFTNSQGAETEFKSGGGGLELCDIGMSLYVDETKGLRRYLNGQIVNINTNTQAFLNRLLEIKNTNPDYFTTEDNWQAEALLNIDGCVYKFVLNYSGETVVSVRLPKYPDYVEINAGGTLPVVGNGKTLGLTNGSADFGLVTLGGSYVGSAYYSTTAFNKAVGSNATWDYGDLNANKNIGVTTDPTKSGIKTTLKQTKLKLRYFIQIATGSETEANIVNTLENVNGFTLLESKYSDKPLYNESWLLSNGQYNAKAVYPTVYEALQVEYNTEIEAGTTVTLPSGVSYTKRGLSVKLSTETYTDYDFVLNTTNETFRLPLKTKLASGKAVVGNGMTLGLSQNGDYGLASATLTSQQKLLAWTSAFGVQAGIALPGGGVESPSNTTVGITTDPTKSGIELSDSDLYLYFYVGDIDQNHGIVNMGRIEEQLANKQDKCIHIIDTYINGTSGYRIWSDGYCHQWGYAGGNGVTVSLLKTLKNTEYHINLGGGNSMGWGVAPHSFTFYNRTASSFQIRMEEASTLASGMNCYWDVYGYLAEGQY